jgi:hypothetical protein
MTDAPETKWLTPNGGLPTGAPWPKSELVEYTRTDISDARISELEAALKRIARCIDIDEGGLARPTLEADIARAALKEKL